MEQNESLGANALFLKINATTELLQTYEDLKSLFAWVAEAHMSLIS